MRPVTDLERRVAPFKVVSDYQPSGDQPAAIAEIAKRVQGGVEDVVLLGATLGTYLATRINTSGGLPMLIVFIATGLLVSVAINFALLKLALTPITRLRETMKLAQAGDLTSKAPVTGYDPEADQLTQEGIVRSPASPTRILG